MRVIKSYYINSIQVSRKSRLESESDSNPHLWSFNGRCYVDACTCRNFWRFNVDVAALLYMLTLKQYSRENRRCRKRSDLVKVFDKFVEQLKELLKDDIEKAGHRPVLYLLST